jgi:hypothetical protein
MNAREIRLHELAYQRHLLDTYMPLCIAAKYEQVALDQLQPQDIYFLATAIQSAVKPRTKYVVEGSFGHHDYIGALKSMTLQELEAMRQRIGYKPCLVTKR